MRAQKRSVEGLVTSDCSSSNASFNLIVVGILIFFKCVFQVYFFGGGGETQSLTTSALLTKYGTAQKRPLERRQEKVTPPE